MRSAVALFAICLLAPSLASGQPVPPPVSITATSPLVVAPTPYRGGIGVISCPTCSAGGGFPVTATGAVQLMGDFTVTGANTGIVLHSTGTGAIVVQIPDNGTAGGNARAANAIDFQYSRTAASQVASGPNSFMGGANNFIASTSARALVWGLGNSASNAAEALIVGNALSVSTGAQSFVAGLSNAVTNSQVGVWGASNTVSGQYATAGGRSNTAGNTYTTVFGFSNSVTGTAGFAMGQSNTNSGAWSAVFGQGNTSLGNWSLVFGNGTSDRNGNGALIQGLVSGSFTTQYESYVLTATTSGAGAVRLTAGGGSANGATIGPLMSVANSSFALQQVTITMKNATSGGMNQYICTAAALYRPAAVASTTLSASVCSLQATTGTIGVAAAVPTIVADTTIGGVIVTVTPPAGNTNLLVMGAVLTGIYQ